MSLKESQSKHWAKKDMRIIQSYWDSPPATMRSKWFVDKLKGYDFDSIMEIGFFAGRNLRYIKEAFSSVKISGFEINPKAVKFAKAKLGISDLWEKNLHNLDEAKFVAADIVFTSGVLIHVPPEDLRSAIIKMVGRARKYVMHIESLGANEVSAGPAELNPTYKVSDQIQWAPDILAIYDDLGLERKVFLVPDDCKTNGATELVVASLRL